MPAHNFDDYFKYYVNLVDELSLDNALKLTGSETQALLLNLSENKGSFAYAEGKWTIKQLLCHCIDTERIFCNRALRFARNDSTDLPGYDHDEYVNFDNSENRKMLDILAEMKSVREATAHMFFSFSKSMLAKGGTANGKNLTVEAIGYLIAGHEKHHINIVKERYL